MEAEAESRRIHGELVSPKGQPEAVSTDIILSDWLRLKSWAVFQRFFFFFLCNFFFFEVRKKGMLFRYSTMSGLMPGLNVNITKLNDCWRLGLSGGKLQGNRSNKIT